MLRFLAFVGSLLFCMNSTSAQKLAPITADVYRWDEPTDTISLLEVLLEGGTPAFSHLTVSVHILQNGATHSVPVTQGKERLIIVREGTLDLTINDAHEMLEPGSVAILVPGDMRVIGNQSDQPVTYYVMAYQARDSTTVRDKTTGSFVRHWRDLAYQPNAKGGRRNVFDTATNQAERFEMHITTLNEGLMSHPPHTHKAAEILLLIEGQAEESIDGTWKPARVGDVIFLQSDVPHAIRNTGKIACTYFAFQFE